MLFDKRMITCKTKRNKKVITHSLEYHKALPKIEDVRYQMIKKIMSGRGVIIDIDTALFPPFTRLNPTQYVEDLQKKLVHYDMRYKVSRSKKEVLDAGLGKVFGMKSSKVDTAYRVSFYMPYEIFSEDYYKAFLEEIGYRVCVLNEDTDIDSLLELFYSGMIDDMDYTDLFYAHFYNNAQLTQFVVTTHHIDEENMNKILMEIS